MLAGLVDVAWLADLAGETPEWSNGLVYISTTDQSMTQIRQGARESGSRHLLWNIALQFVTLGGRVMDHDSQNLRSQMILPRIDEHTI